VVSSSTFLPFAIFRCLIRSWTLVLLVVLTVDGGGGGGGGGGIPGGGGPIHIFTGVGGGGIGQLPFNGVDVLFGCELTAEEFSASLLVINCAI